MTVLAFYVAVQSPVLCVEKFRVAYRRRAITPTDSRHIAAAFSLYAVVAL